jgi:hypothetical protein
MLYLSTQFHMHSSSGPLAIVIQPKAKYVFHAAAVMLFYRL